MGRRGCVRYRAQRAGALTSTLRILQRLSASAFGIEFLQGNRYCIPDVQDSAAQPTGEEPPVSQTTSAAVERVRQHLCSKGLYGDVTEWCEMRGDCVWVVTCPDCRQTFTLDDDDYDELVAWSRSEGAGCGIMPVDWST
jgi:hypothetical protein